MKEYTENNKKAIQNDFGYFVRSSNITIIKMIHGVLQIWLECDYMKTEFVSK